MSEERIIIVGAGMAGATTAYFLTRKGRHNILLLEKEKIAGTQSTGRNAAILRTIIPDPLANRLAHQSAEFYFHPPEGFTPHPLVDRVGIFMAACAEHVGTLDDWCRKNSGANIIRSDATPVYAQIPILAPGLASVAYKPDDGILDVHAILQSFLRGATQSGAQLCFGTQFRNLRIRDGRVEGVETSSGFMEASKVVVANGAWASVPDCFGGYSLPFAPYRRHLLVTEPIPQVNPRWPILWVVGEDYYFRPESGGLLMSACDAVKVTPEQGEITDHSELERIAAKAARWLPTLTHAGIARAWAGMRTFAPDEHFVIGKDPRLQGLYWVAGLGGHGITCAPVVGTLAADWIVDGASDHPDAATLAPDRLVK
jgi:D-arginine dehydrogenase